MLDLWFHRTGIKEQANGIAAELEAEGAKVAVRAPIGAGRHSIVANLATLLDVAIVELPPFEDLDTPLHAIVQLESEAGTLESIGDRARATLESRACIAAQTLADKSRAVVFILPVPRPGPQRENDAATQRQVESIVATLAGISTLRLAVVLTPDTRLRSILSKCPTVELEAPLVGAQHIDPTSLVGEFRGAAARLVAWMNETGWASTPFEARLQVGLIALGEAPSAVAMKLQALARKMAVQLQRRPPLARAVRRLLLARRTILATEVKDISGVEQHWLPLLTACIGYGNETIRVPEVTRQVLLEELSATDPETESDHEALAEFHHLRDGESSLKSLDRQRAIHWLEKVHHLALGGERTAARWAEQIPAGRQQIWEHARYLSRVLHRHSEAAKLFEDCITRFGADPYSSHYLAYNLERARGPLAQIREGYETAVADAKDNPWWQQRWIRYLIAHGTLDEARTAWQRAIREIDPEGTRLRKSPWLALNLHCWVARRWLAHGYVADARQVLSEVPHKWLEQEVELRELVQILTAAEESIALGESVYPASVPLADRWKRPRSLRPTRAGRRLLWWAPGRVVEATEHEVAVVIAPTRDEAQQLVFEASIWYARAGERASDAAGFFELGRYDGGEEVVKFVPDDGEGLRLDLEDAELYERVTTWSR